MDNTSGQGPNAVVPNEVSTYFNWGAFFLSFIWGIAHKVWITLIIIPIGLLPFGFILSLFTSIWFGSKGNEWAWKSKHFSNIEIFHNYQKKWAVAGIIIFIISLGLSIPKFAETNREYDNKTTQLYATVAQSELEQITTRYKILKKKIYPTGENLAKYYAKEMIDPKLVSNTVKTRDFLYTFEGNGSCQYEEDCSVNVKYKNKELFTMPLYQNADGYIELK